MSTTLAGAGQSAPGKADDTGSLAHSVTSPASTKPAVTSAGCTTASRITRSLLGYGVLAGPFYVAVSLAQAVTRPGFDLTRHEWSLLANGAGGWIQVVNLLLTGLMVVAAAVGYRRTMPTGRAARWAPRLLAMYGFALVAAGAFRADPMNGFPVGTPDGRPTDPTVHGTLHLVCAGIGFLALVAAMWLLASRLRHEGQRRLAVVTAATAAAFLLAFAGLATGATTQAFNIAFTAAVILSWAWLSVTSVYRYRTVV
jgi:hypothetical protein